MSALALQALIAGAALLGVLVIAAAGLWAWHEWLAFRAQALTRDGGPAPTGPAARIDLADLRERVRKLEAIAAGVDF